MYQALVALLKAIKYVPTEDELICLGDYIDRGPDSRKVVEFFMRLKKDHGSRVTLLKGNHEDLCVHAHKGESVRGGDARSMWNFEGSEATLASWYGEIPPEDLRFMEALPLFHESKDIIFVHGGVDPNLPLVASDPEELLWCREPKPHYSGKLVMVGHTIQDEVMFDAKANTLFIDTGACAAVFGLPGRLSIVDITDGIIHFLKTDTGKIGRAKLKNKLGI